MIRSQELYYENEDLTNQLDQGSFLNMPRIAQQRILPVTCLGYGKSSLLDKLLCYVHTILLESGGDAQQMWKYRCAIRGYCSDQGLERAIADSPWILDVEQLRVWVDAVERGEASLHQGHASFMLPYCIFIPGHLHMLWNALESAVTEHEFWNEYERDLKSVVELVRDKQLRQLFQSTLKPWMRSALDSGSETPIDWRWSKLESTL